MIWSNHGQCQYMGGRLQIIHWFILFIQILNNETIANHKHTFSTGEAEVHFFNITFMLSLCSCDLISVIPCPISFTESLIWFHMASWRMAWRNMHIGSFKQDVTQLRLRSPLPCLCYKRLPWLCFLVSVAWWCSGKLCCLSARRSVSESWSKR